MHPDVYTLVIIGVAGGLSLAIALIYLYVKQLRYAAEKELLIQNQNEELLQALQENEKLIREQNVVLEQKVTERTYELELSNKELNKALDNLTSVELKLLETQKILNNTKDGYVIIELPNDLRGLFNDMLKGFEEFAKLKGYEIVYSVDNSVENKIAFKFTLLGRGNKVTDETIRDDIKEYIEKIRSGNTFDDLPVILTPIEHSLVSASLKNRISFLQHNYNMEKNTRQHYEKLLSSIANPTSKFLHHQPTIYIQTGGQNAPVNFNTPNSVFGDNNVYDASDKSDYSVITISNSFNKKKEQITQLNELIDRLNECVIDNRKKADLIESFSEIRKELSNEETPSKSRIYSWLSKTKSLVDGLVFTHDVSETIKWIYESFNFGIRNMT